MPEEELPLKCEECSKLIKVRYHGKCDTCRKMEFEESVFCELNRAVQDIESFRCDSFEPRLEVVGHGKIESEKDSSKVNQQHELSYSELFKSDKIKYDRALALQRLKRDPDAVFIQLKYHIAWNVIRRTNIFSDNNDLIQSAIDLFYESSMVVNDIVNPLFLAPDHVHLLVESDGQLPIEEIINKIKEFTSRGLLEKSPFLEEAIPGNSIWDDAYFVETVAP